MSIIRFEANGQTFKLDGKQFFRAGKKVNLNPKELQLLRYVLEQPVAVLSKDDIMDAVWGRGVPIADDAFRATLKGLRKGLGDDAQDSKIIKTIHGQGLLVVPEIVKDAEPQLERPDSQPDAPRAPKRRGLDAPVRKNFFGRHAEVDAILQELRDPSGQPVIPVLAPPGYGKSSLVREVLERVAPDGHITEPGLAAVVWVRCEGLSSVGAVYSACGKALALEAEFVNLGSASAFFQRLEAAGRVWIVFDALEKATDADHRLTLLGLEDLFREQLARGGLARFIVTSWQLPEIVGLPRSHRPIPVDAVERGLRQGLPADDAVMMLRALGKPAGLNHASDDQLRELAERLHRLPQALVGAAGYLNTKRRSVTLAELLMREEVFAHFQKEDKADGIRAMASLNISAQKFQEIRLLRYVAHFDLPLPLQACGSVVPDEDRLSAAIERLADDLLIDPPIVDIFGHRRLTMHSLQRETVRDMEAAGRFMELSPVEATGGLKAAEECGRQAGRAYNATFFSLMLDLEEVEVGLLRLNAAKPRQLAAALTNKGLALHNLGRAEEALGAFDESVSILKALERSGQKELANNLAWAVVNRGNVLLTLGRGKGALDACDEGLGILRLAARGRKEGSEDVAMAVGSRGNALHHLGLLEEALSAREEAIGILRGLVQSGRHELLKDLAMALMNWGNTLHSLGRGEEALTAYDEATRIRRNLIANGQEQLAENLALTLMNKGVALKELALGEALEAFDEAIGIWRELVEGGRNELAPDLARAVTNRGTELERQGRAEEALVCQEEAVETIRGLVAQGRSQLRDVLAMALYNRASAQHKLGDRRLALADAREAEAIFVSLVIGGRSVLQKNLDQTQELIQKVLSDEESVR